MSSERVQRAKRQRRHDFGLRKKSDCLDCGVCPSCIDRSIAHAEEQTMQVEPGDAHDEMKERTEWRQSLKPGDLVRVRDDFGHEFNKVVKAAPWQLGGGTWVVGLAGISGGYLLSRVQAVVAPKPDADEPHGPLRLPTDNQEIEAAEFAVRGLHTCAVCRLPRAPIDRSVCDKCHPIQSELDTGVKEVRELRESVKWWQGVADAKQEEVQRIDIEREKLVNALSRTAAERERLYAALEMLAQIRHIDGSAQAHMRQQLRFIDAALAGADLRDVETVEAVSNGTWKPKNA